MLPSFPDEVLCRGAHEEAAGMCEGRNAERRRLGGGCCEGKHHTYSKKDGWRGEWREGIVGQKLASMLSGGGRWRSEAFLS